MIRESSPVLYEGPALKRTAIQRREESSGKYTARFRFRIGAFDELVKSLCELSRGSSPSWNRYPSSDVPVLVEINHAHLATLPPSRGDMKRKTT